MPVEEGAKKKHKLFPFKILRKRSSKAKGKSKSLVDLYDVRDRDTDEKRNGVVKSRNRLSQPYGLSSSFDTHGENDEDSTRDSQLGTSVCESDLHDNENFTVDNDETDGFLADDCPDSDNVDDRVLSAEIEDEGQEGQEPPGAKGDVTDQLSFPPGTTVCISYVLILR